MNRAPTPAPIAAAIDIGSYSVHLLVAEIAEHQLRIVHDESVSLGLGRTIDETGRLGPAREVLRQTIAEFAGRARALGAGEITIVGTDPLRRAPDSLDAIGEILEGTGLGVAVLTHEEEAIAALLGVQEGEPVTRETILVDVGGGSTEVLLAGPDRPMLAVGLPLGAARLTGVHVRHDPPSRDELRGMRVEVTTVMARAPESSATQLVAVGGTARNLLRVGPVLANRVLTQSRIRNTLGVIASTPAEEIALRYAVKLSRARVLGAGATILGGALDRYGLKSLRVAVGGLREGLIWAGHHRGPGWRAELRDLARGWDRPPPA